LIKNQKEYKAALARVDMLWDAKKSTPAGDELELWIVLIEKYEKEKFPINLPDPIEAIKFRLDQMGYEQKDLAKIIGANRASEVLRGKRRLSIDMIKTLRDKLNIPLEALIK
jgi:HTH-type transcriptional regulator/antitoxin HigA